MEKKRVMALFASGAMFVLVALLVAPQFIWLAGLAGFATGYIGYEARGFFKAVPQAYQKSRILIAPVLDWLKETRPFLYSSAVLGTIATTTVFYWPIKSDVQDIIQKRGHLPTEHFIMLISFFFLFDFVFSNFALLIVCGLAELGARQKNVYFPKVDIGRRECNEIPATYSNVFHCCAVGFAFLITTTVMFCLLKGWYYLAVGIWSALKFVGHFSYYLFKLIHSKGRIICGLYGVLGGLITWAFLVPETANLIQSFFLIFCGGSISVVIGKVLGFEIMAKRILKIVPNGASAV